MYEGLTIADKPTLEDAKARGANWVARDRSGRLYAYVNKPHKGMFLTDEWVMGRTNLVYGADDASLQFIKWSDAEPVNIDLALAQIAEMEAERKPMTVNEWLNISTADQKAKWLYDMDVCRISSISAEECNSYGHCIECMKNMLNSPYTEGATK